MGGVPWKGEERARKDTDENKRESEMPTKSDGRVPIVKGWDEPNKEKKVIINIIPSWFVRNARVYLTWCNCTRCGECGQLAKYEDQHPVNPCMTCGSKDIQEVVGRWIPKPRAWWKLWKPRTGHWEIRE